MPEDSEIIDRWRYVVVLAKFMVHLLQPGLTKAMSVLIPSMVFQLNLNYTTAGFLVSLQISLLYIASPMSNYLSTKFGPRLLSTISGFLGGLSLMGASFSQSTLSLGCSFFFAGLFSSPVRQTSTVILHEHFGEMYGMATTFAHMGGLLGGILLPYVTVLCLEAYGMRGTLLCLSGILFFQTASGATMRPPRHYERTQKKREPRKTDDEEWTPLQDGCSRTDEISLRNLATDENFYSPELHKGLRTKDKRSVTETRHSKSSWNCIADFVSSILFIDLFKKERVFTFLFLPCQFLGEVSFAVWLTFCVSYGLSVGMAEREATYLVMVGSLGGFVGRLILLAILYKYPRLSPHMYPVNLAVSSVALFAYPVNSSLLYLSVCSFFVGFGLYSAFSAFYAAISLKVKRGNFPLATALSNLICGGVFLISGTFAGFLYEILGSFQTIFLITGFFVAIPCLAFCMYFYFDNRQQGCTCASSED